MMTEDRLRTRCTALRKNDRELRDFSIRPREGSSHDQQQVSEGPAREIIRNVQTTFDYDGDIRIGLEKERRRDLRVALSFFSPVRQFCLPGASPRAKSERLAPQYILISLELPVLADLFLRHPLSQGQRTSGGSDMRIASTLPPVIKPNLVPRS
jgi:hypothetical protein